MVHSQTDRSRPLRAVESIAASSRWRDQAACRDADPELFFPVGTRGPAKLQEAEAKAVCARCPVRARCLQVALESRDDYGVRGGMSEEERRDVVRANKKAAAAKPAQKTRTQRSA